MTGFVNMPDIIANDYNIVPLDRTWYEHEFTGAATETIRFAKRKDHTGVLIQINMDEFFEANP